MPGFRVSEPAPTRIRQSASETLATTPSCSAIPSATAHHSDRRNYGMQVIQLPKEQIWLFDWFFTRRVIWIDGRKLPDDAAEPRFYGYSVGRWDGDTFVVESNGSTTVVAR